MSTPALAIQSTPDSPAASSSANEAGASYHIVANPSLRVVTKGAKITYRLESRDSSVPRPVYCEWKVIYDPRDRRFFELNTQSWVGGPIRPITWEDTGSHRIICKVHLHDSDECYIVEYAQDVCELSEAFYVGPIRPLSGEDPVAALDALTRELIAVRALADQVPPEGDALERHTRQISEKEAVRDRLEQRLRPTRGMERYIVMAEHIEAETQTRSPLRLFLYENEADRNWRLVDWTSPTVQQWTGEYEGEGDDAKSKILNTIKSWESNNRYPAGRVRYQLSVPYVLDPTRGEFETDGHAFWDHVSNVLSGVAIASTVVAGVVTLLAPVPGSQLLSAAIWTSLFTSTGAAVINIAERHAEGFGSLRADAFDILTIVGNMFAGANVAASLWQRGAGLTFRAANGVMRMTLIGQVATDSVQGVLVGVECAEQIAQVRGDKSMTPIEKVEKIAEILRSAALTGVLYYVNAKGTAKDLKALKQASAAEAEVMAAKLKQLSDPQAEVDITPPAKDAPEVKGHTEQKAHTTVVQTEPDVAPPHVVKLPLKLPPDFVARFKAIVGHAYFDKLMAEVPAIRAALKEEIAHLSDYEIAAVRGYTHSKIIKPEFGDRADYRRLNDGHRSGDAFEIESTREYWKLIDSALAKLPPMPGTVFREMNGVNPELIRQQFVRGDVWKDRGYLSTSHSGLRASNTKEIPQVTMSFIDTKSGRAIEGLSAYRTEEREILFPRGTEFRVISFEETLDGHFFITLKEIFK